MFDPNNPAQVAWLQSVNSDLGGLVTSNLALAVQMKMLTEELVRKTEENAKLQIQVADMGKTNAVLKEENTVLKARKAK